MIVGKSAGYSLIERGDVEIVVAPHEARFAGGRPRPKFAPYSASLAGGSVPMVTWLGRRVRAPGGASCAAARGPQ